VLFGIKEFVPPLMAYIERYGAALHLNANLTAVDGAAKKAWFEVKGTDGAVGTVVTDFDLLHVCPPQRAPGFIRTGPLADAGGWVEVDLQSLQHARYGNIFGLGDACSAPSAKTPAAARSRPRWSPRTCSRRWMGGARAVYDGYGACPLTVERGKVVLAEFGYGGKLLPTVPWDPTKPRRAAWLLKTKVLPRVYWDLMLRGREWLTQPKQLACESSQNEASIAGSCTRFRPTLGAAS
jgi:sulfide:quinone oxidoreductase